MGDEVFREIKFPKIPDKISVELRDYFIELERRLTNMFVGRFTVGGNISGEIDHGLLLGLDDDDHTQYYNSARHTKAVHDALALDHGSLSGLTDDDHTRYIDKDGSRAYTGTGIGFKDEDDMASDLADATASQQSIKAYIDNLITLDDYNMVENGDFSSGWDDWDGHGADWSIVSGKAKFDGYDHGANSRITQYLTDAFSHGYGEFKCLKYTLSNVAWQSSDGYLIWNLASYENIYNVNPSAGTYIHFHTGDPTSYTFYLDVMPSTSADSENHDVFHIDNIELRKFIVRL